MRPTHDAPRFETSVDRLRALLDDLEAALDEEVREGRARLDERVADLRERVEALRGGEEVEAPAPSRVDALAEAFETVSSAVGRELDEGRERVWAVLDDLDEAVRSLERRVRDR